MWSMPKKNEKIAVIGGGIAGVCTAALLSLKGFQVHLYERSNRLGGCSGSFRRNGYEFNIGATTIAGLKEGFPVQKILSKIQTKQKIVNQEPSIIVLTPKGLIKRSSSLEETLEEIKRVFPNKGNEKFWRKVYSTTHDILMFEYYNNLSSMKECLKSFFSLKELIIKHGYSFLTPAQEGLKKYFHYLDNDYYDFMESHVKIVAQSTIREVNFLTLLLSLGYPFTGIGYPVDGMDNFINELAKNFSYHLNTEVTSISTKNNGYLIKGVFGEEFYNRVILALPFLENFSIIEDKKLKKYLERYQILKSDQSAIVLYGVIKNFSPEGKFYLKVLKKPLLFTDSKYLFCSFNNFFNGKENLTILTASCHTKISKWKDLIPEIYNIKKITLGEMIKEQITEAFGINKTQIIDSFIATPETFYKYLRRRSVGGIPITRKNAFWKIPSNFTPFKGFYLVGDSSFCYQGWIGVSIGVRNLVENFHEKI